MLYEPSIFGVSNNIVLNSYNGINRFVFETELTGLNLINNNSNWSFVNGSGNVVATIKKVIVTDSNGNETTATVTVELNEKSDNYNLIIDVATEFLTASNTVYPVKITPFIQEETVATTVSNNARTIDNIYTDSNYTGTISQHELFSHEAYTGYSDTPYLGYVGGYNMARVIYRIPNFIIGYCGGENYSRYDHYQIASANLHINVLNGTSSGIETGTSPTTISVHPISLDWDYNSEVFTNTDLWLTCTGTSLSTSVSNVTNGNVIIDITDIVESWSAYNYGDETAYNPSRGIVLVNGNESDLSYSKYLDATDTYMEFDYSYLGGLYYFNNKETGKFLTNSLTQTTYIDNSALEWYVEYIGNEEFTIRDKNTLKYLGYSNGSISLVTISGNVPSSCRWIATTAIGGGQILKNVYTGTVLYSSSTSLGLMSKPSSTSVNYDKCVWRFPYVKDYINLEDFSLSDDWVPAGGTTTFSIVSATDGAIWTTNNNFTWSSSESAKFPITANGVLTGYSNGGVTNITVTHKPSGVSKTFRISCGTIREGLYWIQNRSSGMYMEVEGSSTTSGAYVQQGAYDGTKNQEWYVFIHPNGDYIIQSLNSDHYLNVEGRTGASGAQIIQEDNYAWTTSRWKIIPADGGAYRIMPCLVSSFGLGVANNIDGTNIIQTTYDSTNKNEWFFDTQPLVTNISDGSVYKIRATHSSKYVNVANSDFEDGTNVNQNSEIIQDQIQRWKFISVGNGDYVIMDMNSGKLLSIEGSSSASYANAWVWHYDGTNGQKFRIRKNQDGTYSFLSKCSNYKYALTVENSSTLNGANISQSYDFGRTNQKFSLKESNKAIIIVPGIVGSELYAGASHDYFDKGSGILSTNMVNNWLGTAMTAHWIYWSLVCDSNGNSSQPTVTKPYRSMALQDSEGRFSNQLGMMDLYRTMYDDLVTEFSEDNYVVDFFSYDWRMSNGDSAEELDDYINEYGYTDVTFIAHSMGGLVVSGYLSLGVEQEEKTNRVFMVASPLLGTPKVLEVMINEDLSFIYGGMGSNANFIETFNDVLANTTDAIPLLISRWKSIYELLPTQKYFEEVDNYLTLCNIDSSGNKTIDEIDTYAETKSVLNSNWSWFHNGLMSKAEQFHSEIYDTGEHITYWQDTEYIYGINISMLTPSMIELKRESILFSVITTNLSVSTMISTEGDGLVSSASATVGSKVKTNAHHYYGHHSMCFEENFTQNNIIPYWG